MHFKMKRSTQIGILMQEYCTRQHLQLEQCPPSPPTHRSRIPFCLPWSAAPQTGGPSRPANAICDTLPDAPFCLLALTLADGSAPTTGGGGCSDMRHPCCVACRSRFMYRGQPLADGTLTPGKPTPLSYITLHSKPRRGLPAKRLLGSQGGAIVLDGGRYFCGWGLQCRDGSG